MMTETLRRVFLEVEQLPAEEQEALAAAIELVLEEREWDALIAQPQSFAFLERLAAEARQEDAAGLAREATDRW